MLAAMRLAAVRRVPAVRWGIAGNIFMVWVVTLPAAALIAAGAYWLAGAFA
jgi:PiT family inorganic phosphate transporter